MDAPAILEVMKAYFAGKQPETVIAAFSEQAPRALLPESLDVVDFVLHLEEEFGRDIDITELGQALYSRSFGDLARQLAGILSE